MGIKKGRVHIRCRGILKGRWHKRSGDEYRWPESMSGGTISRMDTTEV
jgi:hypothetical protein